MKRLRLGLCVFGAIWLGVLSGAVNATPIMCEIVTNNYMEADSSQVSSCVGAGVGNINGNPATDDFLNSGGTGAGYVGSAVTTSFTQTGSTGTWSVAAAVGAIGFKFGTGNTADEWFIYDLVDGVTSGTWEFFGTLITKGEGGLGHIQAYNDKATSVPEPGTLGLLGAGLLGLGFMQRKRAA